MVPVRAGRRLRLGVLFAGLLLILAGCDWPMLGYGPARTSFNPFEVAIGVGNVASVVPAWTAMTGGALDDSSPAVVDGQLYVGSDKLYALDATTGTVLWSAGVGKYGVSYSSSAVAKGVVYIVASDNNLYAIDATTAYCQYPSPPAGQV